MLCVNTMSSAGAGCTASPERIAGTAKPRAHRWDCQAWAVPRWPIPGWATFVGDGHAAAEGAAHAAPCSSVCSRFQ